VSERLRGDIRLQRVAVLADGWIMFIAALFPPTCIGCDRLIAINHRLPLCSDCSAEALPLPPARATQDDVTALFAYGGVLASAVSRLKDAGELVLAGPLGRLLATAPCLDSGWDLVMPVPAHPRRMFVRGVDHAAAIAQWMVRALPIRARPRLTAGVLVRARLSPRQSSLPREARLRNVEGVFTCPRLAQVRAQVRGKRVLVLDDVTTTGATLRACIAALREAEAAHVGGLALLRTLDT
jgi:ComF family protein